jgi:hypothetical protein
MRLLTHMQPKKVCELFEPEASHEINSGGVNSDHSDNQVICHATVRIFACWQHVPQACLGGGARTMYEEVAQKPAKFAASSCRSLERTFVEMMKPGSERRSSLVCMIGAGLTAPKIVVPLSHCAHPWMSPNSPTSHDSDSDNSLNIASDCLPRSIFKAILN